MITSGSGTEIFQFSGREGPQGCNGTEAKTNRFFP